MPQYIDKSALVAEIERRKSELQLRIVELGTFESNTLGLFQEVDLYDDIISFIDTIEVKEVDLEKEIDKIDDAIPGKREDIEYIARYCFELGLKAQKGE